MNDLKASYTTPCLSECETDSVVIDYADTTHKPGIISIKRKVILILLGIITGGGTGIIACFVVSVPIKIALILIYGRRRDSKVVIFSNAIIKKEYELDFLDKKDALVALQLIGKGGCGEVYKAELPNKEEKIAIKKIVLGSPSNEVMQITSQLSSKMLSKKMRQIRAEVQTIGKIQHRNLLPLLAHVSGLDCHYLVYEYMTNGSLQDILKQVNLGKKELGWVSRYKIALGVATGLEYLHLKANPRIIHRDLKPGNILLDDDLEPRIADFGLAKRIPAEDSHMSVSKVAGTLGYIAPDYYQTMKLTEKSDIYSLGVILGGLMMGKLPEDEFFQSTEEMNMVLWMRNVMSSEHPERALDPRLKGSGYEDQMLQVLKIACFCTFDNPRQRPNSKDVRYMLLRIGSISDVLTNLHPTN